MRLTGKILNKKWGVGARHALYSKKHNWYENLKRFPGALFDAKGYIVFYTKEDYINCEYLQVRKKLNVPKGISSIPGYIQVIFDGQEKIQSSLISTSNTHCEGNAIEINLTLYERDPVARTKCVDYYGMDCQVCGLNFGKIYGNVGTGFIHVHHLIPLSQIGKEYRVDPIQDLRPVCPNCHAIIHRRKPPFSISEVKNMLELR